MGDNACTQVIAESLKEICATLKNIEQLKREKRTKPETPKPLRTMPPGRLPRTFELKPTYDVADIKGLKVCAKCHGDVVIPEKRKPMSLLDAEAEAKRIKEERDEKRKSKGRMTVKEMTETEKRRIIEVCKEVSARAKTIVQHNNPCTSDDCVEESNKKHEQEKQQSGEFPAELVPKDSFDDVYAKMTDEEKLSSNQRCTQCVQSDKDTCNNPVGQPEADKPINQ